MKKIILFVFTTFLLFADIVEIKNFEEIKNYIDDETLVIFDIDNTIMEPKGQVGSDQWFCKRQEYYKNIGDSARVAFEKTYDQWHKIQTVSNLQLVEKNASNIIQKIKETNPTMALTTRGYAISYSTQKNLSNLGVSFNDCKVCQKDVFFNNPEKGVLFTKGILFTNGSHKGKALFKFLRKSSYKPKKIVFINDITSHLEQIESEAKKRKIKYIGLRYGFLDDKVQSLSQKEISINEIDFDSFILEKQNF